jgi:hypothetical protein
MSCEIIDALAAALAAIDHVGALPCASEEQRPDKTEAEETLANMARVVSEIHASLPPPPAPLPVTTASTPPLPAPPAPTPTSLLPAPAVVPPPPVADDAAVCALQRNRATGIEREMHALLDRLDLLARRRVETPLK